MSFFKINTAQAELISAHKVDVEIDISNGLYSFNIVGLGDKAINESKDRISSAIKYCGFKSPKQKNEKVVISLAPAGKKKVGAVFDLPIAIGYLAASKEINFDPKDKIFVGELSLDGETRKTPGIMQITNFAKQEGFKEIYIPYENIEEASFITGIEIYGVKNLAELILHFKKEKHLVKINNFLFKEEQSSNIVDFSEIKGHEIAKRALLIAASGKHNIAFYGPPGTGKSMLARALAGIMPNLNKKQIIETTSIYSFSGILKNNLVNMSPFRAPHHTSSYSSIIGSSTKKIPGEITLSHNGILFLDEFPEFDKRVINSLRQPIEEKQVTVARAGESFTYPANFMLVVAMNPCPCGYHQTKVKECVCTPRQIQQYRTKISGPIIDRIDLWIEVNNINKNEIIFRENNEKVSSLFKKQVAKCINKQIDTQNKLNGELNQKEIENLKIETKAKETLLKIYEKYKLSMRSFHRILKVAKTISDLENSSEIKLPHILEAIQFRYKKS